MACTANEGAFPEFYFFDCQSCHRRISDEPNAALTAEANPGRPLPPGTPPFNDENMIMLSAIAQGRRAGRRRRLRCGGAELPCRHGAEP